MIMSSSNVYFYFVTLLFIVSILIQRSECVSAEEDLTLSWKEKQALDKVKELVVDKLPHDYMKTDVFLVNWIRAADSDVDKTIELLGENLKWRKDEKMDDVMAEDFSDMEDNYPMDVDGIDYEGRPVLQVFVSEWDMRKLYLTGQQERNHRYCMRAMEILSKMVRDAQEKGEAVTRFQVIFDFSGFNLEQHGCLQCIPPYIRFIILFQRNYPNMADNVIFINAPPALEILLRALRPVSGRSLRNVMKIFGTDSREWKKFLRSIIPPDQLDRSLGGTKISTY